MSFELQANSEQRTVNNGQMDNGLWSMVWTMDNGLWSMVHQTFAQKRFAAQVSDTTGESQ